MLFRSGKRIPMFCNIFITLLQQILNDRLLLLVINGQNSNFRTRFKLELITTYHLGVIVKMFENIIDVALLLMENVNICCIHPYTSLNFPYNYEIMKLYFQLYCFLGIAC